MRMYDLQHFDDVFNRRILQAKGLCSYPSYIIMSEKTFSLFNAFSKHYDYKDNKWIYSGDEGWVPREWTVAIDKSLRYKELVIK